MIVIPVVGYHDVNTKELVMKLRRHASNGYNIAPADQHIFKLIRDVWPGTSSYVIELRGERMGEIWIGPIPLGDDIELTPEEFIKICKANFVEPYNRDLIQQLLNRIINTETDAYKLMIKLT